MKRLLCITLLGILVLLAACGEKSAEIVLTPLERATPEFASDEPVKNIEIRTPFGHAVAALPPESAPLTEGSDAAERHYVLNTGSRRFHAPTCPSVQEMKAENRTDYTGSRDELIARGYQPCGRCQP